MTKMNAGLYLYVWPFQWQNRKKIVYSWVIMVDSSDTSLSLSDIEHWAKRVNLKKMAVPRLINNKKQHHSVLSLLYFVYDLWFPFSHEVTILVVMGENEGLPVLVQTNQWALIVFSSSPVSLCFRRHRTQTSSCCNRVTSPRLFGLI